MKTRKLIKKIVTHWKNYVDSYLVVLNGPNAPHRPSDVVLSGLWCGLSEVNTIFFNILFFVFTGYYTTNPMAPHRRVGVMHSHHWVQLGRNLRNFSEVLQFFLLSSVCHTFLSTYFLLIFDQNMYHTRYQCVPINTSTSFLT